MRGKPGHFARQLSADRLIPAHAGKTQAQSASDEETKAHPRACGENHTLLTWAKISLGSSPRMRGKREAAVLAAAKARLIPAHAGKTAHHRCRRPASRAHPRACGENETGEVKERLVFGSSPRMRGKRERENMGVTMRGLIPAHAGKTSIMTSGSGSRPAHPRACGENQ